MDPQAPPSQIPFPSRKYNWLEYLGGNMADIYRAREFKTDREVIVKVLKAEYCRDSELQARFAQEAKLACQCRHQNIVATYDADEQEGLPYIVMEFIQGDTLRQLIQRGEIKTQEEACWIGLQLALALGYLQSIHIVHRDLKPANVVIDQHGTAKLLDFGIARVLNDAGLTQVGVRVGTLSYMSPEQVNGERLTFASDMYAFGVLLFELLTFQLPYGADADNEFFGAILRSPPRIELLQQAQVPAEVITLVSRCLEKEARNRYASFGEICAVLQRYVNPDRLRQTGTLIAPLPVSQPAPPPVPEPVPQPPPSRMPIWIGTAALVVALAAIAFWFLHRTPAPAVTTSEAPAAGAQPPAKVEVPAGMALVAEGTALLGADKKPVPVAAFYIDLTEVTNGAYLNFCSKTGHPIPNGAQDARADYPVVRVTLADAKAFAEWTGKRLPTGAEWEKAARGSNGQAFPWGDQWRADAANIPADDTARKNATVASADSFSNGEARVAP